MVRVFLATGLMATLLVGCTEPIEPSVRNPDHFSLEVGDGMAIGSYNPEGWTSDEARSFAAPKSCPLKEFASYEETAREDGFVDFVGLCP